MALRSLADLPFEPHNPETLLGIVRGRPEPDQDYAGYGWALVERILLEDVQGVREVRDALLIAVHSADVQPPPPQPIDLEFEVGDQAYVVALPRFLEVVASRLPIAGRPIVLAMCNPQAVDVEIPRALAPMAHYAHGDVIAWLDERPDGEQLRLSASRWCTAPGRGIAGAS